jgi:hypothetical protein
MAFFFKKSRGHSLHWYGSRLIPDDSVMAGSEVEKISCDSVKYKSRIQRQIYCKSFKFTCWKFQRRLPIKAKRQGILNKQLKCITEANRLSRLN